MSTILRFTLIFIVLVGFGLHNSAKAQIGSSGLFCPSIPNTSGVLEIGVESGVGLFPDFSAVLIGTVDNLIGGPLHAGMDWMHVRGNELGSSQTNQPGSQLISWWSQKDGRNTYLQVVNGFGNQNETTATWVHVHIFNDNCVEIRNFCDFYTEFDTHVYNFGDLVSNGGQELGDANLQGNEGFVTVTAVDECPSPGKAKFHNWLTGSTHIKSVSSSDYLYGFTTYHRKAICNDEETNQGTIPCDNILDGSEFKFLEPIIPTEFRGLFNAPGGSAGADVVLINFFDQYEPTYEPQSAFINSVVGIWDDAENMNNCGEAEVCFVRLGINDALVLSEVFVGTVTPGPPTVPPTPGPTPTPTPTAPPTLPPLPPGTLVTVTEEPEGENCASGGLRIDTGADDNGDGNLQQNEIDETFFVCRELGALLDITEEPPGENCEFGGVRVDAGIDDNEDGVLQTAEIDDTSFICSGAPGEDGEPGEDGGETLVDILPVEAGQDSACPSGGIRVVTGTDRNGNGQLEENEIETSQVVCNGEAGADGQDGTDNSGCALASSDTLTMGIMNNFIALMVVPFIVIFARRYKRRVYN